MNKKLLILLLLIGCATAIITVIIVRNYNKKEYKDYTKEGIENISNTEIFVINNSSVADIRITRDREDVTDNILEKSSTESLSKRKEILYAVYKFTNNMYTNLEEHYFDVNENKIVDSYNSDDQQYVMTFDYNDKKYMAMGAPRSDFISIYVFDKVADNSTSQEEFNKQHKKKDISTYDWSYLMRYREDATDEEIAYTLQANIVDVKIFDRPRDNIFTGDQFKCRYKYGFVIDNVNYYYDCIIDLDNGVVYAYVWRE